MLHAKFKWVTISFSKLVIPFLVVCFTVLLIVFSGSNLSAAKNGINLWLNSVLPSLFPFFIATELLSYTPIISYLGRCLHRLMYPIFHVPGEGSFALFMGIISGYPTGAKIVSNFYENGICTRHECERLLAFTNNSGPLFIVGTVGSSLLGNTSLGFLLLFTHILACFSVGLIFRFWKYKKKEKETRFAPLSSTEHLSIRNLGEVMGNSIQEAFHTVVMIGGFVILFSVINSMLLQCHLYELLVQISSPILDFFSMPPEFWQGIYTGILELTNGVQAICQIPSKSLLPSLVYCSFLLGFGGISVLLQVWSILAKSHLSIKPYLYGKILHGFLAAFYTYAILQVFPLFPITLTP